MLKIDKKKFLVMNIAIFLVILAALPLFARPKQFSLDEPVLTTSGLVSGSVVTQYKDMNGNVAGQCRVHRYVGIPYAAAPVGDLRWKPPQPRPAWPGVLKADQESAPYCYQSSFGPAPAAGYSEDCLYVNVYTPAETSLERLPVMVWIHGGAFLMGSASDPSYVPVNLARQGVVVVSINYRVGVFGWLAHPLLSAESTSGTSGNYGALDWIAGLDWVKKNIHAFGGDPHRVTIFGQSSGGDAIVDLLVSPLSKGKFDRAIVESGTGAPTIPKSLADASTQGIALATNLRCTGSGVLACLRGKSPQDVLTALNGVTGAKWEHILDGWFLPRHVFYMFEDGDYNDVPVIFGNAAEDSGGFMQNVPTTISGYQTYLSTSFGAENEGALFNAFPVDESMTADQISATAKRVYTLYQAGTRGRYYAGIVQGKKQRQRAFVFEWGVVPPGQAGAYHGSELAYLFGNGQSGRTYSAGDLKASALIQRYWIQFATTGNPNNDIPNKRPGRLPKWPAYRQDVGQYLLFGNDDAAHIASTNLEAWDIFLDLIRDVYPPEQ